MLSFAIESARLAGKLILARLSQQRTLTFKGAVDLTTDADHASEALLVAAIRRAYPDHDIIAEEGGGHSSGASFTWVIDPIDGTTNYAHGFPFFSVSVGLLREGQPFLGVVYDPVRDEVFAGQLGEGARLNGRRIAVSTRDALIDSLLATGFPYDRASVADNNLAEFGRVVMRARELRRAGSAALELAYVAAGRLDGHWEKRLKPWDTAAGALLVLEAGGRISTARGEGWDIRSADMVATNGLIHEELLSLLQAEGV